ncbi:MAG TPA: hypothetical protein VG873_01830 [Burkholderiales bacterium]|nr:hypothetical protein [Burkholderiales bacterium]
MGDRIEFPDGGFAFLKGAFARSQGVVALPGYAIERARLRKPLPLKEGFAFIARHLKSIGRPLTAFCACELRSPEAFGVKAYAEFDEGYGAVLRDWKLVRDGASPVARTLVVPADGAPQEPCFHAFSYTLRPGDGRAGFVVSASGEWPSSGPFPDARAALDTIDARLRGLGVRWADATVAQVYTAGRFEMAEVGRRVAPATVAWHWCRPAIEGLAFEMDARGLSVERVLGA